MTQMDASEERATSILKESQEKYNDGQVQNALQTLHTFLTDRRTQKNGMWNKQLELVMRRHIELCVELHKDQPLREALNGYRFVVMQVDVRHLEEAVKYVIKLAMEEIRAGEAALTATPTQEEEILTSLTGESFLSRCSRQKVDAALAFFFDAMKHCAARLNYAAKLTCSFHRCMKAIFEVCDEFGSRYPRARSQFDHFADVSNKHFHALLTGQDRASFLSSEEHVENIMEVKLLQLRVATKLGLWRTVTQTIEEFRAVVNAVSANNKPIRKQHQQRQFEMLSEIFRLADNAVFHAHCSIRNARLKMQIGDADKNDIAITASQAVLAVLCVPLSADDVQGIIQSRDVDREKYLSLAKNLGVTGSLTRTSVAAELVQSGLLDNATPVVQDLFHNLFEVSSVNVCRVVSPMLNQIKSVPALSTYVRPLEDLAVHSMLLVLSKCFKQVSVQHFFELATFFKPEDYVTRVEPLLLASIEELSSRCQLRIDQRQQLICFQPKVPIGTLVDAVADAVRPCAPQRPIPPSPFESIPLASLMARLDRERQRCLCRSQVAVLRQEKAQERGKLEKQRIEQRKQDEIAQKQKLEEEHNLKAKLDKYKAEIARLEKEEGLERRRWVVRSLQQKYSGFRVPPDAPQASEGAFLDVLSGCVFKHKREKTQQQHSDVRRMDYFECACRQAELEKRQVMESEQAARLSAEHQTRMQNMREMRKTEWEAKLRVMKALAPLQAARKDYERTMQAAQSREPTSKFEEQQQRLQRDLREREEAAEEERRKKAPAASAKQDTPTPQESPKESQEPRVPEEPAAQTPTPATEPQAAPPAAKPPQAQALPAPSKGAWVPKHRQQPTQPPK